MEEMTRLFGLDFQLLHDVVLMALAVFFLFLFMSKMLFEPARKLLNDRKNRIAADIKTAETDKQDAAALKAEYDAKLKEVDKEAEQILADAQAACKVMEQEALEKAAAEKANQDGRAHSAAEQKRKTALLQTKQEIIAEVIGKAYETLKNEDTKMEGSFSMDNLQAVAEELARLDAMRIVPLMNTLTDKEEDMGTSGNERHYVRWAKEATDAEGNVIVGLSLIHI